MNACTLTALFKRDLPQLSFLQRRYIFVRISFVTNLYIFTYFFTLFCVSFIWFFLVHIFFLLLWFMYDKQQWFLIYYILFFSYINKNNKITEKNFFFFFRDTPKTEEQRNKSRLNCAIVNSRLIFVWDEIIIECHPVPHRVHLLPYTS